MNQNQIIVGQRNRLLGLESTYLQGKMGAPVPPHSKRPVCMTIHVCEEDLSFSSSKIIKDIGLKLPVKAFSRCLL